MAKETKSQKKKQDEKSKSDYTPRIRIKIKSYDYRVIDETLKEIISAVSRSGAKVVGPIFLPTVKRKYTVLRSSFVHKNSQDQFEKRIHNRLVDIMDFNHQTLEILRSLNLPAGVDVEIKM
ncbi:30S ribosomal protein S10 [Candidatus Parcubacteria bacterium 4484_255]|nr:MAG: 30S ribosomal protein S10 [Candidatus Parcubacteria bacterium 4484_255]